MRHSVAWYVYIISLHYYDFNLTTTPTQRHLSLKLPSCKVQKIVFVQWWYNDGLPDELATISYLLKTFLGFNTEHSAQNVPICRCMIYTFDICQLYFLFDLLILQIKKPSQFHQSIVFEMPCIWSQMICNDTQKRRNVNDFLNWIRMKWYCYLLFDPFFN